MTASDLARTADNYIESATGSAMSVVNETSSTAIAAAMKADVEARFILAHRFPRNMDEVRLKLLAECRRPRFAEVARYKKPVGKKKNEDTGYWEPAFIEGPSIRFAEAVLRSMRNLEAGSVDIYDDTRKKIVRVSVKDLETNASLFIDVTVSKTVERRELKRGQRPLGERVNSYGDLVYIVEATDDEVLNKQNSLISKAIRNMTIRLVPGDIQDECMDMCITTQNKQDAEDPDAARKRILDVFSAIGIGPTDIETYLGHAVATLLPHELMELRSIYAAISQGETSWRDIMELRTAEPTGDKTKDAATEAKSKQVTSILAKSREKLVAKAEKKANGAGSAAAPSQSAKSEPPPAGREMGDD